jgi:hypothetical protein
MDIGGRDNVKIIKLFLHLLKRKSAIIKFDKITITENIMT